MSGREVFARVLADAARNTVVFLMFAFIVAGVGSVFHWVLTVGFWAFVVMVGLSAAHTALMTALGVVKVVGSFFSEEARRDLGWLVLGNVIRIVELGIDVSLAFFLWSRWSGA